MLRLLVFATVLILPWFAQAAGGSLLVDPSGGTVLFSDSPGSDDGVSKARLLGFNFTFFGTNGTSSSTVDVAVNGNLNFSNNSDFVNVELGLGTIPRICPLWDDLQVSPGSGDSVTEKVLPGVYYAATWTVHDRLGLNRHVFQVVLFGRATTIGSIHFLAGDIAFSYQQVGALFDKGSATVGLDAGDMTTFATTPAFASKNGLVPSGAASSLTQNFGGLVLFRMGDANYTLPMFDDSNPVATSDTGFADGTGRVIIPVLSNDSAAAGRSLFLTGFTQGSAGTVTQNDDGSLNYKPGASFSGHDQFTYTITDDLGLNATGNANISTFDAAHGSYAGPLSDDSATVIGTLSLALDVHGVFTGAFDDGMNPAITFSGAFDGGGLFHHTLPGSDASTPGPDLTLHLVQTNGLFSIVGTINGDSSGSGVAIRLPNRPPVALDDLIYMRGTGMATVPAFANDSDPDGDSIVVSSFTQPTFGSVSLAPDSITLRYFPAGQVMGSDQFSYTIRDTFGLTATATVRIIPASTLRGVYEGLIQLAPSTGSPADPATSGHLKLTVAPSGAFTGSLVYGGLQRSVQGSFSAAGRFTTTLVLSPQTTVTLNLAIDSREQANQVTGTVSDGLNVATVSLGRSRYDARNFPAPQSGVYTVLLAPDAVNGPAGYGYGRATISKGGAVSVIGKLGDGSAFSFGAPLGVDGVFAVYLNLPRGPKQLPGFLMGQATFADLPGKSDFDALLTWYRPPSADGSDLGYTAQPELMGAIYRNKKGARALPFADGPANANFNVASTDVTVTVTPNNLVSVSAPNDLSLRVTLQPATGLFSGSYLDSSGAAPSRRNFAGALLQKQTIGGGLVIGGDFGPVLLGPPLATSGGF